MAEHLGTGVLGSFGQMSGPGTIVPPGYSLNAYCLGEMPLSSSGELPAWLNCLSATNSGLYSVINAYASGDAFYGTVNAYALGEDRGNASGLLNAYALGAGVYLDSVLLAYALNYGIEGSLYAYANGSGLMNYFGGFTEFNSSMNAYLERNFGATLDAFALGPGTPDSGILNALATGHIAVTGTLDGIMPNTHGMFSGLLNAYSSGF